MKKREFRNLRQGNRTVAQYVDDFSKLSRYAPDDVAIDAAKQEKFTEGLKDEMSMQLMVATFNNYQELVDKALMIEGKQQQIESRKRKYGQGKYTSGAQQKPRLTPNSGGLVHNQGVTTTLEEDHITTVVLRMGMGTELTTITTTTTTRRPWTT